ncbi:MAG TPA: tRNA(His) guanylyltransferase Thg1 family protein [Caulifigura sp.]|jgi:tRNA(His) 5'-end guanylyltransferase|nr:tRNA(His) guanylyltransferase Thg1 family protein [Caulifigura sp.]
MKFDDLDRQMRVFETSHDFCVLPDMFIVARLDGRGFTRLTKELQPFETPFDERFRDLMVETARSLMTCGFGIRYAYQQSDEISLLFEPQDQSFGRKERKIVSLLAGQASAEFSVRLGTPCSFDCRVVQLPNPSRVIDYFRWRSEDAARNALSAYCYWTLRKEGFDAQAATDRCRGLSVAQRNELLYQRGINFNDTPLWQRRGIGVLWETHETLAANAVTGEPVPVERRRLRIESVLPMKEEYSQFIEQLLSNPSASWAS